MRFEQVLYEKKHDVAVLTLDNPEKLNVLSAAMRKGLIEGLGEAERDDEVKVVILTGRGRAFCAGADLPGIEKMDIPTIRRMMMEFFDLDHRIEKLSKPVIAAVNGFALGGGFELALACDLIIASEKAQFGTPEPRLGLMPGFAVVRLPNIVGRHKAKEIIMTTDYLSSEEAFRVNIVNRVVPEEMLMDEAMAMAKKIMQQGPLAIQLIKAAVNKGLCGEELAYATEISSLVTVTEDAKAGITAFSRKEKPAFKGK